jgi:DnaJ-class molecular chaperone
MTTELEHLPCPYCDGYGRVFAAGEWTVCEHCHGTGEPANDNDLTELKGDDLPQSKGQHD